ncbi:hypothetical protein HCCG_01892 [Helicobacter cinaedi CCUG 18818 = ATCC BAA-847]|uniref:Uncharacterized protein n=1 Tax=Helicobacter cinaedi CCUG 18818 = ATCC BAA-847 TaxID=537971 RepID=A0ABN0BEI3_9HELI|nr:hypothetical protein HCCG_01892 [Helicobacter cinaedi CCUG 18818 = ATCC BAA-847]
MIILYNPSLQLLHITHRFYKNLYLCHNAVKALCYNFIYQNNTIREAQCKSHKKIYFPICNLGLENGI